MTRTGINRQAYSDTVETRVPRFTGGAYGAWCARADAWAEANR